MMISSIGNNSPVRMPSWVASPRGFTFIEVMTALAILSGGLVMLYKSFFLCLDYQSHLASRAYANNIIEHRIALTEQMLRDYKTLSFNQDLQKETVDFYGRPTEYQVDVKVAPAGQGVGLYQIDVAVHWHDQKRDITLRRSAFISSLMSIRKS